MKSNETITSFDHQGHTRKSAIHINDCEGKCHIEETAFIKFTSDRQQEDYKTSNSGRESPVKRSNKTRNGHAGPAERAEIIVLAPVRKYSRF